MSCFWGVSLQTFLARCGERDYLHVGSMALQVGFGFTSVLKGLHIHALSSIVVVCLVPLKGATKPRHLIPAKHYNFYITVAVWCHCQKDKHFTVVSILLCNVYDVACSKFASAIKSCCKFTTTMNCLKHKLPFHPWPARWSWMYSPANATVRWCTTSRWSPRPIKLTTPWPYTPTLHTVGWPWTTCLQHIDPSILNWNYGTVHLVDELSDTT